MSADPVQWLLLMYSLPAKRSGARVKLWRQLRKAGALPLKAGGYVVPDWPELFERFQWLAQLARDCGGDATLVRVAGIEGLESAEIRRSFCELRAADYAELEEELKTWRRKNRGRTQPDGEALQRIAARFERVRAIDFFHSREGERLGELLRRSCAGVGDEGCDVSTVDPERYRNRTWLTRPRPQVDRAGSAWLIRRFIDPQAQFVFGVSPAEHPDAVPYDMYGVEFSHHGEDCTFETLMKRFGLKDPALQRIAEMVHEADLGDGKFSDRERVGIEWLLRGWAALGLTDEQLLERGGQCFEALYAVHCPRFQEPR